MANRRTAVEEDQVEETSADGSGEESIEDRRWYVIHTYSGYENKVKKNLESRIESMDVREQIFQVVIPTEEEIEIRDGRMVVPTRPGIGLTLTDQARVWTQQSQTIR